jgi:sugar lactone lactonase YvrE
LTKLASAATLARVRRLPLLALLAPALLVTGSGGAEPPSVRLVAGPRTIVAGAPWTGTVRTTGKGTPAVSAQLGATIARGRVTRLAAHRFRVRLRLDRMGTWRLTATLARRRFALGSITVREPGPYALDSPAYPLVLRDGSVLVTERGIHNRLLCVDPATGVFTVFARGISSPFGVAYDRDGSILVSNNDGLYRIAEGAPPTRISDVSISPFAVLPSGEIAFGNVNSVGIMRVDAQPRLFPVEVDAPHGVGLRPDGDLVVSDTGHNRLLRINPATGAASVITTLQTPVGLVMEPGGSALVLAFEDGRLVRVSPSGAITTVASGLPTPYGLARAGDGTVYVTKVGEARRATGALLRVDPNGTVTTIRLTPATSPVAASRRAAAR